MFIHVDNALRLCFKVNNAGCMVNTREFVESKLEVNFATNTLGTHILTKTLIPVLEKAEKPRVVSIK